MPLVTLSVQSSMAPARRRAILDAVHAALVAVGVPPADRFQRVLALEPEAFVFDPHYPETAGSAAPRDERFVIVEVLWSVGRSVKLKRLLLQHLVGSLEGLGFDPAQLMLVFKETAWESWSFAGGQMLHA